MTIATMQASIDAKMFAQSPIHIIERFLESFTYDGGMTFPVPQHILEALAVRFRDFLAPGSPLSSLDEAFGGTVARQRQARVAADRQLEVVFLVVSERQRVRNLKGSDRGNGTPHEIACENVAEQLAMSVDNVRRLYKDSKAKKAPASG